MKTLNIFKIARRLAEEGYSKEDIDIMLTYMTEQGMTESEIKKLVRARNPPSFVSRITGIRRLI